MAHHVDTGGRLAEDDEVRHAQRSCDGHKVLQHVLLPNLRPKQTVWDIMSIRRTSTFYSQVKVIANVEHKSAAMVSFKATN